MAASTPLGEEGFSRLAEDPKLPSDEDDGVINDFWTAYAFTINYIFGAGVLGVPYAVAHAGLVGSSVFLVLFSFMSIVAAIWVVEACARGEAYVQAGCYKAKDLQQSADWANLSASFTASFAEGETPKNKGMRASMDAESTKDDVDELGSSSEIAYEITSRRFEVAELADMFIGKYARMLYDTSVTVFSLVSMWLYAVLFALSLAETLPLPFITSESCTYDAGLWTVSNSCRTLYWMYILIFLGMMLFTTTVDLSGQVTLQKSLTAMAFSCVFIMVVTLFVSIFSTTGGHMILPEGQFTPAVTLFDINGFGTAFSTFVFAQLCHHGIPGLMQLLGDKKSCKKVFGGAISTTCTIYLVLGIPAAIFFGQSKVAQQGIGKVVTLNWGEYTEGAVPWHSAIQYIVRLYPSISVFAAFPLYANTLGKSWEMLIPAPANGGGHSLKVQVLVRWAAVVPGIIGASLMSDASTIISIGGLFGFVIELVMPALLSILSARKCREHLGGDAKTPYGWHFSSDTYAYSVLAFSAVAFPYAVVTLVLSFT